MDQTVIRDQWDKAEIQALQAHKDQLVRLELQVFLGPQVMQVGLEQMVKLDQRVVPVLREALDHQEHQANLDQQVLWDLLAQPEHQDSLDLKVL